MNPKSQQTIDVTLSQHLRFRCLRCATFCCRLGGPQLTEKDAERIRQGGYDVRDFLEPVLDREFKGLPLMRFSLKSKGDGSCVFLRLDSTQGVYGCSIYDFRPALCRLYPFDFERIGPNVLMLRIIPCCKGLNYSNGEIVDEEFIMKHLFNAILELM